MVLFNFFGAGIRPVCVTDIPKEAIAVKKLHLINLRMGDIVFVLSNFFGTTGWKKIRIERLYHSAYLIRKLGLLDEEGKAISSDDNISADSVIQVGRTFPSEVIGHLYDIGLVEEIRVLKNKYQTLTPSVISKDNIAMGDQLAFCFADGSTINCEVGFCSPEILYMGALPNPFSVDLKLATIGQPMIARFSEPNVWVQLYRNGERIWLSNSLGEDARLGEFSLKVGDRIIFSFPNFQKTQFTLLEQVPPTGWKASLKYLKEKFTFDVQIEPSKFRYYTLPEFQSLSPINQIRLIRPN